MPIQVPRCEGDWFHVTVRSKYGSQGLFYVSQDTVEFDRERWCMLNRVRYCVVFSAWRLLNPRLCSRLVKHLKHLGRDALIDYLIFTSSNDYGDEYNYY